MMCVGLTGGAGSGKNEAADIWRSLGVPVLCADDIAREATTQPSEILNAIRRVFDNKFFTEDGHLKRRSMRKEIVRDENSRKKLEAILHPYIRDAIKQWLRQQQTPYAIIVVPLLVESGMIDMTDTVIVIDCAEELQIRRVMDRDQCSRHDAEQLMVCQLPSQKRLKYADFILENNKTKEDLKQQIIALHSKLTAMRKL